MADMLTIEQVASQLSVHRNTVEKWLRSGEMHGHKLGKKIWRIPQESLDAFLSQGNNKQGGYNHE